MLWLFDEVSTTHGEVAWRLDAELDVFPFDRDDDDSHVVANLDRLIHFTDEHEH